MRRSANLAARIVLISFFALLPVSSGEAYDLWAWAKSWAAADIKRLPVDRQIN